MRHEIGLLDVLVDEDGNPPCGPPDQCAVCGLFSGPRDGETWTDWYARITGYRPAKEMAS